MTSLGVLFIMGWVGGIALTATGLRAERRFVIVAGALLFVATVISWMVVVRSQ